MVSSPQTNASALEAIDASQCDITLLFDRSGSMNSAVGNGVSVSRWNYILEWAKEAVQEAIKYDEDGIGLGFFNHEWAYQDNVSSVESFDTFTTNMTPGGSTMMGAAVKQVLDGWFDGGCAKPLRMIVVTDGAATDADDLKNTIIEATKKMKAQGLQDHNLGILFAQIGDDAQASRFLGDLDDNLSKAEFDIVDTKDHMWIQSNSFADLLIAAETD